MLNDYNNFSALENYGPMERRSLFGDLSSVRNQSDNKFASEKVFAHYLVTKGIISVNQNNLFSGKIIREKNKEIKRAINFFFLILKHIKNNWYNKLKP